MSYQDVITISGGVTSTGLVVAPEAAGGDATVVNIQSGGTLADGTVKADGIVNGTFGATAANLKTEAGAKVNLETATGSGLMLTGGSTDIAEDTLYWNGKVVHGATVGGVLSGVSSTDPYRFCVGSGITVLDAKLTSGTRIYTYGDSLISRTTILESGNIGMTESDTVGREITVGGAGVAEGKATLQIRGTAYDTVVSEGGRANVYNAASDTEVYAGGFLEVKDGGRAVGAEIHGGSMGVSSGACASGANVSSGAKLVVLNGGSAQGVNVSNGGSMVVSNGGIGQTVRILDGGGFTMNGDTAVVKDFTTEEGGKFSVIGDAASSALISGANITPLGGNSTYALIDKATVCDMNVNNGATANSMTVKRATWTGGTVQGGSNSTDRLFVDLNYYVTANNVTFTTDATESATGICLVSAGANGGIYLNDVTIKNFAYLEYARGVANNLSILDGGYMYQRATAVVSGVTISGVRNGIQAAAVINGSDNRMTDAAVGSGGKLFVNAGAVNGATVLSGGTLSANGAGVTVSDLTVSEGGVLYVSGTAASRATVSGATITPNASSTAGAAVSAWNANLYDMDVLNGRTSNYIRLESATWTGGTVRGGSNSTDRLFVNLWYADKVNNVTFTTDAVQSSNLICYVSAGVNGDVELNDVTVKNFAYIEFARGSANNLTILDGGRVGIRLSVKVNGAVISGMRGGSAALLTMAGANNKLTNALIGSGGKVTVTSGTAENILVNKGGTLEVQAGASSATLAWLPTAWSGSVVSNSGANISQLARDKAVYFGGSSVGLIAKGDTLSDLEVTAGNSVMIFGGGTVNGASASQWSLVNVAGGTVRDVTLDSAYLYASGGDVENVDIGTAAGLYVSNGGVAKNINVSGTSAALRVFSGGMVSGANIHAGGSMVYSAAGASGADIVIGSGGRLVFPTVSGTYVNNITILAGGSMASYYSSLKNVTGTITLDLNGADGGTGGTPSYYMVNNGFYVAGAANKRVVIANASAQVGDTYGLENASNGYNDTVFTLVISGGSYNINKDKPNVIDPFKDQLWRLGTTTRMTIAVSSANHTITAVANAASLATSGSTLNGNDREARWTDQTSGTSGGVFLASGMTAGNAWLKLESYDGAETNLFGAAKNQNFTGAVNINASGGTLKNIAAGAGHGGKVGEVRLTIGAGMTVEGAVYAGGMGSVTGETETLIESGAVLKGDVFAGAICNYAVSGATTVGSVGLTVNGGSFNGNIFAGAAVKAGDATARVHSGGDIKATFAGGSATGNDFCFYGGGYATGNSVTSGGVYEAGNVSLDISGGTWGGVARGGRGIFGGVYANKVAASVRDVNITVTGGTIASNVYGGGWAQQGGMSTVGNVNITIDGGSVRNVYGGGSYSTSGDQGATSVGNVAITISGGTVNGSVYGGGQGEFSTVAGDVSVTISGGTISGGVYGYGTPSSAAAGGDTTLTFAGYVGTINGVGGFDAVAFTGNARTTLTGTVANTDWTFDYTDRTLGAETAMLTLDDGALSGEVAVDLSTAVQSATGWSIATGLTSADATYSVELSTGGAADLALGDVLDDAYGIYEGWGFTLEDSTLKFNHLA